MSKIGYFLAVPAEKIAELAQAPTDVADFLGEAVEDQDELGADFLDVDKAWHAIHFLLTGSVSGGESPLAWTVFAPLALGDEKEGARALAPTEVIEVSQALAAISPDKLKRKCDLQLLNASEIYPQGWQPGDQDYIAENFASLKKFYDSAARRRMGIIQWFS